MGRTRSTGVSVPAMPDLRAYSADDVLRALARRGQEKGAIPSALSAVLADGDVKAGQDASLTAFLSTARILDNQESNLFGDLPAEVYMVSLAFDMTGTGGCLDKAADTFHGVAPKASRPLIISTSQVFENIYDGDRLPLLGNGIPLYGPSNPKGFLDIHVAIMENDDGYRQLGQIIEDSCKKLDIADKLGAILTAASVAAPEVFIAKNAVELLFHVVVTALKNNWDDVIQDVHFSSLAHQGYLAGVHRFNERGVSGTLTVDVEWK